ncbi:hypothetical protein M569_17549 [Genlisea aurea]|uniref:PDZ domain-containing protein n=1 Tax=Genlisea aurea TaxID=192259 RepID=S8BYN0_9LAMI|nr:hypothetical protein M569_17549 [Genlisea aurea]
MVPWDSDLTTYPPIRGEQGLVFRIPHVRVLLPCQDIAGLAVLMLRKRKGKKGISRVYGGQKAKKGDFPKGFDVGRARSCFSGFFPSRRTSITAWGILPTGQGNFPEGQDRRLQRIRWPSRPPQGEGWVGWRYAAPDRETKTGATRYNSKNIWIQVRWDRPARWGVAGVVDVAVRSPPLVVQDPAMEATQGKMEERVEKAILDVAEAYIWEETEKEKRRVVRRMLRLVDEGTEDKVEDHKSAMEVLRARMWECSPEVGQSERDKWMQEVIEEAERYKKGKTREEPEEQEAEGSVAAAPLGARPGAKRPRWGDETSSEEETMETPVAAAPSGARPGGKGGLLVDVLVEDSPLHRAQVRPGRDMVLRVAGQDVTEGWDKEATKKDIEGKRRVEVRVVNVKTGKEREVAVRVDPAWRLGGEFPSLGVVWRWVTWEEARRTAEKVKEKKWETSKYMKDNPTVAMRRRERRRKIAQGGAGGDQ